MQLGLARNIGSVRGSGCKDAPAHRSDGPGNRQRLRTSKGPCQPFGTGQISPHAALSPPHWVSTQQRRLRHTFRGNCRGRGHAEYSDRLPTVVRASTRSALFYGLIISLRGAGVKLPRTADLHVRIRYHFLPMRDPPGSARDREHDGEHRTGNAQRAVDDARIEVDVRVQLARYEVFVLECNFLELERQIEQRIVGTPEFLEHPVAHAPNDLRAWVEILVDAVTEAHEPDAVGFVFDLAEKFIDLRYGADAVQHVEHGLVCSAVCRPPQRRHAG